MSQTLKYFDCNLFVSFFTYVLAYLLSFLISYMRQFPIFIKYKVPRPLTVTASVKNSVATRQGSQQIYFDYFIISIIAWSH